MISRLLCLLALTSLCLSSPIGGFEKELTREGLDVDKLHEELERLSDCEEVEGEFAEKETQDELAKLRTAYDISAYETVEEENEIEVNGELSTDLFEGDIVLTPEQWSRVLDRHSNAKTLRLQGLTEVVRMWTPMGAPVIPYSFADGFPDDKKKIINETLAFWEGRTCIRFRPANTTDDDNFIEFNHKADDCNSAVGMEGGKQTIDLAHHCFWGSTLSHELSHTFGALHTQTRSDRDNYIIADTSNVEPGKRHNFMKNPRYYGKTSNYRIPYEFGSIMHYRDKAFSINRTKPTIYARGKYAKYQGSMSGPIATFYDTLLINKMYKCTDKCKETISCDNYGVQDGNKCNKCFCPKGWDGRLCKMRPKTANVTKLAANQTIKMEGPTGNGEIAEKLFIIEAPVGKRINASVTAIGRPWYPYCGSIAFEIIPTKDTRTNGIKFCGKPDPTPIESDSNQMLVWMYNSGSIKQWTQIKFTLV